MTKVIITMPCFNEAEGIEEFIKEIDDNLVKFEREYIITDDKSSDETIKVLESLGEEGLSLRIISNNENLGHGPSTLKGLRTSIESHCDYVLSIDGDGQFLGSDVRKILEIVENESIDIVEGVRINRSDPKFRNITSYIVRLLVFSRCGILPRDANTPLRAYKREVLKKLMKNVNPKSYTPNLFFSSLARHYRLAIKEVEVSSIPRRGTNKLGSSWGKSVSWLPTKKFVKFCIKSAYQWFSFRSQSRKPKN